MTEKTNDRLQPARPIVVLSGKNKCFLAAARRDDESFAYVLALVCNRKPGAGTDFNLTPVKEVYAFESKTQAGAFYGAVQQMIAMNKQLMEGVFDVLETPIKCFNENIR